MPQFSQNVVVERHPNAASATANYAAVQTNTALVSAPSAGVSIYLTDVIISANAEGYVTLEEDTASAQTVIMERLNFADDGGCSISFSQPIKLTAAKDLGVTSVTTDDFSITVCYYTE